MFTPHRNTKTAARSLYEKLKTEQHEHRLFPERYQRRASEPVQALIDRYLTTISQKLTAHQEATFADWWGRWYKGRTVLYVTTADLEAARAALLAGQWSRGRTHRPRSPARVNRYTQWLHQVFAHPINRQTGPIKNPVDELKKYAEPEPPPTIISPEQEHQLLAILERETPGSSGWARLAATTGLRQLELFHRRKTDVDLTHRTITVPRAKSLKKPKRVAFPDEALPILRRLLATPGPWLIHQQAPYQVDCDRPFPVRQWYKTHFRRAIRVAGLPKEITWHTLRHTWASRMLEVGASTRIVQVAAGWSSSKMVERYAKVLESTIHQAVNQAASLGTATSTASGATTASDEQS